MILIFFYFYLHNGFRLIIIFVASVSGFYVTVMLYPIKFHA